VKTPGYAVKIPDGGGFQKIPPVRNRKKEKEPDTIK
jgi:hypothetical protein